MANVILIAPYVPYPPTSGGKVRTWNLLRRLSGQHAFTLLCLQRSPDEERYVEHLLPYVKEIHLFQRHPLWSPGNVLRAAFSPTPFLISGNTHAGLTHLLSDLIDTGRYDLIHAETLYVAQHVPPDCPLPVVLVDHNVESQMARRYCQESGLSWRRAFWALESWRTDHAERELCQQADVLVAMSEVDADHLRRFAPDRPCLIAPNGVDTDEFAPSGAAEYPDPTLVFVGSFRHRPNTHGVLRFAREVWPLVTARRPETRLLLVGQDPPAEVRALAADRRITVTGLVPDVRPYVEQAQVFIAPLYIGSGTRLKILEALSLARPVVTTPVGAEGLDVRSSEHLILADSPAEQAFAILSLLDSPERRQALGRAARALVQTRYDWSILANDMDEAYRRALGRPKAEPARLRVA